MRQSHATMAIVSALVLWSGCSDDSSSSDSRPTDSVTDSATTSDTAVAGCSGADLIPARVDSDLTVGPGCVRLDRTEVREGAVLTIAPGTTVAVEASGFMNVSALGSGAALVAKGTATDRILFTSVAASPSAGDWQCVRLGSASSGSELEYVTFEYGGQPCEATGADFETTLDLNAAVKSITNVTVRHSQTHGVLFQSGGAVRQFDNNTFSDNGAASILVHAKQLLALGAPNTFVDADDFIEVDTTFGLETTGTWRAQSVPFRVPAGLDFRGKATVTIEAGTRIEFLGGSMEVFDSTIAVEGTTTDPVVFTSAQASPAAGDWGCVYLNSLTGTASFANAVFEFAGNGERCSGASYTAALVAPKATIISGSTFRSIAGDAIKTREADCNLDWCDNTFESVSGEPAVCGTSSTPISCL